MIMERFGFAVIVFFIILFVQELFSKDEESDSTKYYS